MQTTATAADAIEKQAIEAQMQEANLLNPQDILQWLADNPDFFVRHAAELTAMQPQGENVTSLHVFRASKAEKHSETLTKQQEKLLRTAKANSLAAESLFAIIPTLVSCTTLATIRKFLQKEMKTALAVNATRLLLVGESSTATTLTTAEIEELCPAEVSLRTLYTSEERAFYGATGKMMKSDALLKLSHNGNTIGLLALGSKDETRFHVGQGTEFARFLSQTFSAVLARAV